MNKFWIYCFYFAILFLNSCKEDPPKIEIPTTYNFERDGSSTVSFSGQTQRLGMLSEMDAYLKTTRNLGNIIAANQLKAMFANAEGSGFTGAYEESKQLKSKCFSADTDFFEQWMEAASLASAANINASPGVAGHLNEEYPAAGSTASAGYLVNENGIEYHQIIIKGLMGAVLYYQAAEIYFGQDRMGELGNDDLVEGKNYTNMEHYFDEAFGYFGVSTDFSDAVTSSSEGQFWGKYCIERHVDNSLAYGYAGINSAIMESFKKGRAAVVAKDYTIRDEAIKDALHQWEIIIAATAADYLERSLSSSGVPIHTKHHYLSESIGFLLAIKYHFDGGNSIIPRLSEQSKIEEALRIIGLETSLYEVSDTDIQNTIDLIEAAFPNGEVR